MDHGPMPGRGVLPTPLRSTVQPFEPSHTLRQMTPDVILGLSNAQYDLPSIVRIGEECEQATFHIGLLRWREGSRYRPSRSNPAHPEGTLLLLVRV